jgi:hypothetical protein
MAKARDMSAMVDIKIRMREPLRAEIEQSASSRGVSMNTEMVDRLAASFNRQRTGEALDFSHGGRLAGSVQIIAKVIEFAAHEALLLSPDGRGKDWLSEPYVFDQVAKALGRVIEGLRPVGDPAPPTLTDANRDDWHGVDLSPIAERIGERASATVLDAVIDPTDAALGLGAWAKSAADKLGEKLVARIRARERGRQ